VKTLLPHIVGHLRALDVEVADDGGGDAPFGYRDRFAQVELVAADAIDGAIAADRRMRFEMVCAIYLATPAGRAEGDERAVDLAVELTRRLMASHEHPVGPFDRDAPNAPVTVTVQLHMVTMLGRGVAAEVVVGERLRELAHALAMSSPDGLVNFEIPSAQVEEHDDDQLLMRGRCDITFDPYAGTWRGVRSWLVATLRRVGWRVDDDGWGAGVAPEATFGGDVAGITVLYAASAEVVPHEDGLVVLLRAPTITTDGEEL